MKKIANLLAVSLLIIGAGTAAYASAEKSRALINVFYINANSQCVAAKAETICTVTTTLDCIEPLYDATTSASLGFSSQIYASRNVVTQACQQPYDRP